MQNPGKAQRGIVRLPGRLPAKPRKNLQRTGRQNRPTETFGRNRTIRLTETVSGRRLCLERPLKKAEFRGFLKRVSWAFELPRVGGGAGSLVRTRLWGRSGDFPVKQGRNREFKLQNRELSGGSGNRRMGPPQLQIGGPQPPLFADFRSRTAEDPMTCVDVRYLPNFVRFTYESRRSWSRH